MLAACAEPQPTWERTARALRACPAGDQPWRDALKLARSEEKLDALATLADETAADCADRWEPAWAAGEVLKLQNRLAEAEVRYDEAARRARAALDPTGIACSANRLGTLAFRGRDLGGAQAYFEEALEASARAEREDLASYVHNNFAGLLVETGDFVRASEELDLASRGLEMLGLAGPARAAAYNRAVVLFTLGNAVAAGEALERIRQEAAAAGDARTREAASVVLGNLHLALDRRDAARSWYGQVGDEMPQFKVRAELGLGRIALAEGDDEGAIEILDRVVAAARETAPAVAVIGAVFLAEAEAGAGRTEAAKSRLEALIAEGDTDSGEAPWAARAALARIHSARGEADAAVELLEQAVDYLDRQSEPLNPLKEGLYFLRTRADPYVDLAVALHRRDGEGARQRILDLAARAQARALRQAVRDTPRDAPVAELRSLQRRLDEGDLLLNYLVSRDQGLLLAITHNATRAVVLPGRRELAPTLDSFREALLGEGDVDPHEAGARLRETLIDPVADLLGTARRLLVVPDRELAQLPFAALPLAETAPGEARYLGAIVDVAFLPLVGGAPGWSGPRSPLLLAAQPRPGAGFAELPWSAFEASGVRKLWGDEQTSYLSGAELTPDAVVATDLAAYRTLHFATHAVASTRDPRRCGIVLADGERLGIDRISTLELNPATLVVLSGCRSGEGEVLPGEGVVGLGWAFFLAGARGIVASLWTVDDVATARLMVAFHERLRDGDDPVRALAGAQRELARSHPDPATWAPFVILLRPEA